LSEKMRKVLFLMFLLLLMGLGAAGVKAQVRIGGNGAPNAAAVLDLNATDATTGTKGLALPRVNLTSNTMQITTGVANLIGMLVYNTTATLGTGIYFWNGTNWVIASLPATSRADSGFALVSNGSGWVAWPRATSPVASGYTATFRNLGAVTWYKSLDTVFGLTFLPGHSTSIVAVNHGQLDLCYASGQSEFQVASNDTPPYLIITRTDNDLFTFTNFSLRIRCYHASM